MKIFQTIMAGAVGVALLAGTAATAQEVELVHDKGFWSEQLQAVGDAAEEATGVRIVETPYATAEQYKAFIQASIASGSAPDMFTWWTGATFNEIVESDAVAPLDDIWAEMVARGDYEASAADLFTVDGHPYAVPLLLARWVMLYNKPLFEELGISEPQTWDELMQAAEALKAAGVEAPIVLGGKDWVHPYFMYIGLASSVLGPEGVEAVRKGEKSLADPDVVAAVQLLLDLMPYYNQGFEATDYTTAKAIFANGQGAMMVAGTADFTGYHQVNPEADLSFIAWPGPEEGKGATTTGFELLYTASAFTTPEKQAAAAKFINWLATEEAQQLVMDTISLSINKNVTESTDPIREQTVAASAGVDVPVWYAVPELNGSVIATQDNHGGLWTGRISAQEFSDIQQAAVVPSGS
ncbi:MAG: extracellular solute-binding protein [Thermomicrobiales bacterium]|nr:extracellular solute-binding protein [Thermomicrobiales bacterium]